MLNATGPAVVEARDVTVAIGGRPVLRGNDLVVREGEFVALMGANGSGKSTLVRALTGLRPLTQGTVLLFGAPLHDFRARHRLGYVPQRGTATGGVPASVREVVSSGRLTRRGLLRPTTRADRAAIDDALDVFPALRQLLQRPAGLLSGGQAQQLAIARALVTRPKLLVLDEPTEGIQPSIILEIEDAIAALHASAGMSILLVEQYVEFALRLADRYAVMDRGVIVHDGHTDDADMDTFADLLAV